MSSSSPPGHRLPSGQLSASASVPALQGPGLFHSSTTFSKCKSFHGSKLSDLSDRLALAVRAGAQETVLQTLKEWATFGQWEDKMAVPCLEAMVRRALAVTLFSEVVAYAQLPLAYKCLELLASFDGDVKRSAQDIACLQKIMQACSEQARAPRCRVGLYMRHFFVKEAKRIPLPYRCSIDPNDPATLDGEAFLDGVGKAFALKEDWPLYDAADRPAIVWWQTFFFVFSSREEARKRGEPLSQAMRAKQVACRRDFWRALKQRAAKASLGEDDEERILVSGLDGLLLEGGLLSYFVPQCEELFKQRPDAHDESYLYPLHAVLALDRRLDKRVKALNLDREAWRLAGSQEVSDEVVKASLAPSESPSWMPVEAASKEDTSFVIGQWKTMYEERKTSKPAKRKAPVEQEDKEEDDQDGPLLNSDNESMFTGEAAWQEAPPKRHKEEKGEDDDKYADLFEGLFPLDEPLPEALVQSWFSRPLGVRFLKTPKKGAPATFLFDGSGEERVYKGPFALTSKDHRTRLLRREERYRFFKALGLDVAATLFRRQPGTANVWLDMAYCGAPLPAEKDKAERKMACALAGGLALRGQVLRHGSTGLVAISSLSLKELRSTEESRQALKDATLHILIRGCLKRPVMTEHYDSCPVRKVSGHYKTLMAGFDADAKCSGTSCRCRRQIQGIKHLSEVTCHRYPATSLHCRLYDTQVGPPYGRKSFAAAGSDGTRLYQMWTKFKDDVKRLGLQAMVDEEVCKKVDASLPSAVLEYDSDGGY